MALMKAERTTSPMSRSLSRLLASSMSAFQPQICGIFLIGSRRDHWGSRGFRESTPRAWTALMASAAAATVSSRGATP